MIRAFSVQKKCTQDHTFLKYAVIRGTTTGEESATATRNTRHLETGFYLSYPRSFEASSVNVGQKLIPFLARSSNFLLHKVNRPIRDICLKSLFANSTCQTVFIETNTSFDEGLHIIQQYKQVTLNRRVFYYFFGVRSVLRGGIIMLCILGGERSTKTKKWIKSEMAALLFCAPMRRSAIALLLQSHGTRGTKRTHNNKLVQQLRTDWHTVGYKKKKRWEKEERKQEWKRRNHAIFKSNLNKEYINKGVVICLIWKRVEVEVGKL